VIATASRPESARFAAALGAHHVVNHHDGLAGHVLAIAPDGVDLPPSPGWVDRPSAYLRLSDAYHQPADQARALGWPVIELAGHHLSILTQPELVLQSLLDLVDDLQA
jgi:hypothetical protein